MQYIPWVYLLASKFGRCELDFRITCHENAKYIYLGVFLFLDYILDAESAFKL